MISEEPFMKFFREKKIVDMLKVRASYGEIGSDQLGPDPFDSSRRWLYMNQWAYGGHTTMDLNQTQSIYTWYRESAIGNKDIQWEVVKKLNVGIDYSFLEGLFAGSVEFFRDVRSNIFVYGGDRSIPSYLVEHLHLLIKVKFVQADMNWSYVSIRRLLMICVFGVTSV